MPAARRHPTLRTVSWRRRCERLLLSVGVLLPIPVLAASGLSLPLPGPVERLAAALVPFAEAATTTDSLAARAPGGSIVRLGGESEPAAEPTRDGEPNQAAGRGGGPTTGSSTGEKGDDRDSTQPSDERAPERPSSPEPEPVKDGNAPSDGPTREQDPAPAPPPPPPAGTPPPPPPPPAATPPPPPPPPPPPIVTDPGGTIDDTLDDVDDTVDETVEKVLPGLRR